LISKSAFLFPKEADSSSMNKPSPKAVFIGIGEIVIRTKIIAKLNIKNTGFLVYISLYYQLYFAYFIY
jgi:hypothetical protein